MKRSATGKLFFYSALLLLILSVVLAVVSLFPVTGADRQTSSIIDDSFMLSPWETYRQGLGSFHGDENITLLVTADNAVPSNFSVVTYGGPQYTNLTDHTINYTFPAGADYYEAVFLANSTGSDVHFQVLVEKNSVSYPFSWVTEPAKALFLVSCGAVCVFLLLNKNSLGKLSFSFEEKFDLSILSGKNLRILQVFVVASLVFWFVLLAVNTYPLATFENWYTDAARNPYSATLFTKVGFHVFNTPLGVLSSGDASLYKFVTWAEMPNLYPFGSILLFLPFGAMLEQGVSQALVFKLEIALFLVVAHACLYFLLKRFWKQDLLFGMKAVPVYLLYVALVVYSANGMYDAVALFFSLIGLSMFLGKRYDFFLLLMAVATFFKYQAAIFLFPLIAISILKILQQPNRLGVLLRNKAVLAAAALFGVSLFTAYLSAPFLMSARPELIMNSVNAFSPHAQIPWMLQALAVLLTLGVTLGCAVYLFDKSRLASFFAVFSLVPCFTMPYFQPWYLPFFFVVTLLPMQRRAREVTVIWLCFMMLVLSFAGLSFNPLSLLENLRKMLGF